MNTTPTTTLNLNPTQSLHPHSANYYLNFPKSSRKIGALATKSYFHLLHLLQKDIPSLSLSQLTNPITSLVSWPFGNSTVDKTQPNLDTIVKMSNEVLDEAKTVFPMTLFPDTITLDRTKLTVTRKTFFMSGRVISIHIEDVLNVGIAVGPLFGSLTIAIKGLTSEDHFSINYLWRSDAIRLKHIIQGYINAIHDNIDTKQLKKNELTKILIELGHDSNT